MIDKYINDNNEVAVLYSGGYGAGWSSWNSDCGEQALFDPVLVQAVLDKKSKTELVNIARERYPTAYLGGLEDSLRIEWVPQGEKFYLHEYDGSEWIVREDGFHTA